MSMNTLTNPGSSGLYGSTLFRRRAANKSQLHSGIERYCFFNHGVQNLFFKRQTYIKEQQNLRVEAGWFFKGGGNEKRLDSSIEHSETANEDILVFFFQLDLATRVQYALNLDQYDIAQQLRNKLTEVEEEVIRQRDVKKGSTSKSEVQDQAIRMLRLRAELQNAIDTENYAVAAELRDEIAKLEAESLAVSAKALAYENVQYAFRLGQKVRHKIFGYRGVICGMDPVCCESSSWMETANVQSLSNGSNQPFYQVLVDVHEDPELLVAYVPEENLVAPDKPDLVSKHLSRRSTIFLEICRYPSSITGSLFFLQGRFNHPYASFLFYGVDTAGDFIPIKQLREKYNQPRHEVPLDPDDEETGEGS